MAKKSHFPDVATQDEQTVTLTSDDRNAVRAFLARGETRLSTIHRVVAVMLVSIGIMSLIPIFIFDRLIEIVQIMSNQLSEALIQIEMENSVIRGLLYFLLSFPLSVTVINILHILFVIMKNIVTFYLSATIPGLHSSVVIPGLTLTGMNFPSDESPRVKTEILRQQYSPKNINYILPLENNLHKAYFDSVIEATKNEIIPRERNLERLREEIGLHLSLSEQKTANYVSHGFGIARSIDRTIIQEASILESTIARSLIILRQIVFHYFQLVISVFWTGFVILCVITLLHSQTPYGALIISCANIIWSLTILKIMNLPVRWIREVNPLAQIHIDEGLALVERKFSFWYRLSTGASIISLIWLLFYIYILK